MIAHRAFRFKLFPTPEQDEAIRQHSGVCRLVYNLALEQRMTWGRKHKLGYLTQCRELTALRREFDWIAAVSQTAAQQALKDLDRAFQNFFAGRAKFPTWRKGGVNDGFRFAGRECAVRKLNAKWAMVRLPKIGEVKLRLTRAVEGRLLNVTIANGHVSFACEIERVHAPAERPDVGIDRGVANTLALSNGEMFHMPDMAAFDRRRKRAQREAARRKRGSKRRARSLKRAARLSAKAARIRQHFNHVASTDIARRFAHVAIEDLRIVNMTASAAGTVDAPGRNVRQKSGLNRSILNQGWGQFETLLGYKLEERGGALVKVDPRHTSQTCPACGCIDRKSRDSQARFSCVHCGHEAHADINAAIVILTRRNTSFERGERASVHAMNREPSRDESLGNPRPSGRGRR